MKLYLAVPEEVGKRLQDELPQMQKKIAKLEGEIDKLKGRMSSEADQNKTKVGTGFFV